MKEKVTTILFLFLLGFFFLMFLVKDKEEVSFSERRKLASIPSFDINSILKKETMNQFETYALDHFYFRDGFRKLKSLMEFSILHKLDNNKIYVEKDAIYKMEYPLNEKSIDNFTTKINHVLDTYLKHENVYYSIIPDKNYYSFKTHLSMDYDYLYDRVKKDFSSISEIDLRTILNVDDYYRTDTHWKQQNLEKVVREFSQKMNFKIDEFNYQKNFYQPFYGVYYGQAAMNLMPDELVYLSNETIENSYVTYYGLDDHEVYNTDKLEGMDSYDVFLNGANPLITIENSNSLSDKELIVFRDSFGSSLIPLFIESYQKITVIDLRYLSSSLLDNYVSFDNQDVLFLYSTLIVNQSGSLK